MELNQFFLIAGGLLFLSILLIGAGAAMYRNQKQSERKRISAQKLELRTGLPPAPLDPEPVREPQGGDTVEIMRVYRRPVDGGLRLQVMGEAADHVGEMTLGQVEQLKRVVREIAMWVENKAAPPAAGAGQTMAASTGERPPGQTDSKTDGQPGGASPGQQGGYFADSLPAMPDTRDLLLGRRKKPVKAETPPEPPKSIAAQIDEILQSILASSPLRGQEIRLSEDPGGGLNIIHNAATYQAIDDVEDPAARNLIKPAVQAWNEQNKIG